MQTPADSERYGFTVAVICCCVVGCVNPGGVGPATKRMMLDVLAASGRAAETIAAIRKQT
jgi:hypothetical protein